MPEVPIIQVSGQRWKATLGRVMLVVGLLAISFSASHARPPSTEGVFVVMLAGLALVIAGFAFPCLAIRCPQCAARWYWKAVSQEKASRWYAVTFGQCSCPVCGYPSGKNDDPSNLAAT